MENIRLFPHGYKKIHDDTKEGTQTSFAIFRVQIRRLKDKIGGRAKIRGNGWRKQFHTPLQKNVKMGAVPLGRKQCLG